MKVTRINAIVAKQTIMPKRIATAKNVREDIIYQKLFIMKTSNEEHYSETFIADPGAKSHMVNSEGNVMNLKDYKTRVTVGDSRTLTITIPDNWHEYQIRDRKFYHVKL